ncbi:MAG: molybdate ABC transporter substrate-binding protein [Acidobacteria bacterium]|nr:molybdate ABC transporter substrate-binding protein [Acidobacteriota bacterium]
MRRIAGPLVLALALLLAAVSDVGAQIAVAAASDLQPVLPDIATRFQRATGQTVRISYGSSGTFVSQIQNGAPFDVFLSADDAYVRRLVDSGHGDPHGQVGYATGRLALWSRKDRGLALASVASLGDGRIRRIAIANPDHAPYGRAAVDALERSGVYEQVRGKIVRGENVAQAAQFAQSGSADVAIVALSLTLAPAMAQIGTAVELPMTAFAPIRQTAVVLTRSRNQDLARRFVGFLVDPDIQRLLQSSGFGPHP